MTQHGWPTPSAASSRWSACGPAPRCPPGRWTASPAGCTSTADLVSEVCDPRVPQPADRPVLRRGRRAGRHPGRALPLHHARGTSRGVSTTVPLFGSLTATTVHRDAARPPLPERTWVYEIDTAAGVVRYDALDSPFQVDLPLDPMHGTVGVAPATRRGALVARSRRLGRQHGHPGDARRHHLLPRRQRRRARCSASATATPGRARARPAASPSSARWTPCSCST